MTKHTYLGVRGSAACILRSLVDFDTLNTHASEIESSDFVHDATNWGGSDTVERTCKLSGFKPTGRNIRLNTPIVFSGTDYDMGHEYGWTFQVDTICEVR